MATFESECDEDDCTDIGGLERVLRADFLHESDQFGLLGESYTVGYQEHGSGASGNAGVVLARQTGVGLAERSDERRVDA